MQLPGDVWLDVDAGNSDGRVIRKYEKGMGWHGERGCLSIGYCMTALAPIRP